MILQMHKDEEIIRVVLDPQDEPIPPDTHCWLCGELAVKRDSQGHPICDIPTNHT